MLFTQEQPSIKAYSRPQLWNDTNSRQLLEEYYPWFLPTYNSYRYPVQRVDTIRLFALLNMGGIYIDLDQVRAAKPLTHHLLKIIS
jgi:mannosyltransferase OCH1-like enzyme